MACSGCLNTKFDLSRDPGRRRGPRIALGVDAAVLVAAK